MQKSQRKIKKDCKIVTIKQPTILELKILYQAIIRNKRELSNIFK